MSGEEARVNWHALDMQEVFQRQESGPDGLGGAEAAERLEAVGANTLEAEEDVSPWELFWRQVHNPLIYLLLGAAALSLAAGKTVDAGVIAGVVVLNTVLGFVQEWRAEGALAALRQMAAPHAVVVRDGEPQKIEAGEVVPGDVLELETGDRVAADARLLSSDDMHVNESALTGESEPAAKDPGRVDADTPMGDRRNMVWMSTSVTGGRGRALVVATGMRSEMGQIAGEVRGAEREQQAAQRIRTRRLCQSRLHHGPRRRPLPAHHHLGRNADLQLQVLPGHRQPHRRRPRPRTRRQPGPLPRPNPRHMERNLTHGMESTSSNGSKIRAYLDIETTGLSRDLSEITVVGIAVERDGQIRATRQFDTITDEWILESLHGVDELYTYNGSRFDLPMIKAKLKLDLKQSVKHTDLMYACWKHDLKGGLKAVEKKIGITRDLPDMDGYMAVVLWWQYKNNADPSALKTLLKYNEEDVVNLDALRRKLGVD